jgi:hypothetical protein
MENLKDYVINFDYENIYKGFTAEDGDEIINNLKNTDNKNLIKYFLLNILAIGCEKSWSEADREEIGNMNTDGFDEWYKKWKNTNLKYDFPIFTKKLIQDIYPELVIELKLYFKDIGIVGNRVKYLNELLK